MSGERFTLDTNLLIYCFDRSAGVRQAMALRVVELAIAADCWLTLQAVSEFYAAVTRKRHLTAEAAGERAANWLAMFPCLAASPNAVRIALRAAGAGRVSYWDGLLVASAAEGGCSVILTEDLQDGAVILGAKVINPFGETELTAAALAVLGG